jgi:hypothetical protein
MLPIAIHGHNNIALRLVKSSSQGFNIALIGGMRDDSGSRVRGVLRSLIGTPVINNEDFIGPLYITLNILHNVRDGICFVEGRNDDANTGVHCEKPIAGSHDAHKGERYMILEFPFIM